MEILPAIDIQGARVIRLRHGNPAESILYPHDPFELAERYLQGGVRTLHVVDLDRAFGNPNHNEGILLALIERFPHAIQVGGGIRDHKTLVGFLKAGAFRVVIGTLAFLDPEHVLDLARAYPGRVSVALDCRGDRLQANGWIQEAPVGLKEAIDRLRHVPEMGPYIVTQVERDGTLEGPDIGLVQKAIEFGAHRVILSGGVGILEHLIALKRAKIAPLEGVIVGKALLDGRFSLSQALQKVGPC
jgi:phosphoribosylformimino-5-aminoimidazole carboxamide ribotide isomerase